MNEFISGNNSYVMFYQMELDTKNLDKDIGILLEDVSVNAGKPRLVLVSCDQCLLTLLSKVKHNVYLINQASYERKLVAEAFTVVSPRCYQWYHRHHGNHY